MDSRQKKQLKRQLEGQASLLVSENSDVALVAGLLTTCSALLRTAEQNMPAAFTNQEFDQIYCRLLRVSRWRQPVQPVWTGVSESELQDPAPGADG